MELEIKHLAPYLPFSLNGTLKAFKDQRQVELIRIGLNPGNTPIIRYRSGDYEFTQYMNHFIPFLRPLFKINEEIEHKGNKFVPEADLYADAMWVGGDQYAEFINHVQDEDVEISELPYWFVSKLFEWHFDVFQLIDSKLAKPI